MDNTVKETWIDKLIDELVDTKAEIANNAVDINQFYNLIKLIFNNARLDYSGESMRLDNDTLIFEYLRVIDPETYAAKLDALKVEREAEIKRLAEEKTKSKCEVKEA